VSVIRSSTFRPNSSSSPFAGTPIAFPRVIG
jgi:hypothetical protein